VQQLCKSCRTCFMFYCMFYFTCDRSLIQAADLPALSPANLNRHTRLVCLPTPTATWSRRTCGSFSSWMKASVVLLYRYVSLFGNRWVRLHGLGFIQVFSCELHEYLFTQPPSGSRRMRICFAVFFVLFVFRFSVHQNYETTVLGNGERIFMKLSPNDRGECSLKRRAAAWRKSCRRLANGEC